MAIDPQLYTHSHPCCTELPPDGTWLLFIQSAVSQHVKIAITNLMLPTVKDSQGLRTAGLSKVNNWVTAEKVPADMLH